MNNKRFNTPKPQLSKPPPPKPSLSKTPLTSPQQTRTLHDSLVSGLGFGIGNSIANKLMNNVFASGIIERTQVINPPNNHTCNYLITELDSCILHNEKGRTPLSLQNRPNDGSWNEDCNDLFKKLKLHECQYEQYESQKPKIIYNDS